MNLKLLTRNKNVIKGSVLFLVLFFGIYQAEKEFPTLVNLSTIVIVVILLLLSFLKKKSIVAFSNRVFFSIAMLISVFYYLSTLFYKLLDLNSSETFIYIVLVIFLIVAILIIIIFQIKLFALFSQPRIRGHFTFASFLIISTIILFTHNLYPMKKALINDISGLFTGEYIDFVHRKSPIYSSFEKLRKRSSNEELIKLLDHRSPSVRCYAFIGLISRDEIDVYQILSQNLHHSDRVTTQYYDIWGEQKVSDIMLEYGLSKLNETEISAIDSLIIWNKHDLAYSDDVFLRFEPISSYYNKIKEVALNNSSSYSIIALAKYNRESDKALIKAYLTKTTTRDQLIGLMAVRFFPSIGFMPIIKEMLDKEIQKKSGFDYLITRELYNTLVQYKNYESVEILNKIFETIPDTIKCEPATIKKSKRFTSSETIDEDTTSMEGYFQERHQDEVNFVFTEHTGSMWLALKKYPDTIYTELLKKIESTAIDTVSLNAYLEMTN